MGMDKKYKSYHNKFDYSYSFGTFGTVEMIKNVPEYAECVLVHESLDLNSLNLLKDLCSQYNIPLKQDCNKLIEKIRNKESCNVIGVFTKFEKALQNNTNHVVLVNPGDMGNMGTIIRTCLGFGIKNIAIIRPGVDIFNPKVVRASMGAIFQLNIKYYDTFDEYRKDFMNYDCYPFMLKGAVDLNTIDVDKNKPYALIFGNESSGLDDSFLEVGQSVFIKHNNNIDSLNLGIAVGIGLFEFQKKVSLVAAV